MDQSLKEEVNRWILKAENDLKNIELQINTKTIIPDTACFHAQQAVEKFLKAFIVYNSTEPERTHKIEKLLEKCAKIDSSFMEYSFAVRLTEYAVEARYPDDYYEITTGEVTEAYNIALKIKNLVLSKII